MTKIHPLTSLWLQAVATRQPRVVTNLYAPQGILLGTVAPQILVGRKRIITYFNSFLKKPGLQGTVDWEATQDLPGGLVLLTGCYTFAWHGDSVRARYTFLWGCDPKTFKPMILNHHSSTIPKGK